MKKFNLRNRVFFFLSKLVVCVCMFVMYICIHDVYGCLCVWLQMGEYNFRCHASPFTFFEIGSVYCSHLYVPGYQVYQFCGEFSYIHLVFSNKDAETGHILPSQDCEGDLGFEMKLLVFMQKAFNQLSHQHGL